jgi:hypothetical protein
VSLTVAVGEPGSVSTSTSPLGAFTPGGFPSCQADLELRALSCGGLVPGARYRLVDGREHATVSADGGGSVLVPLRVRRGDAVRLSNGSRTLSTLHVARLRVDILGEETFLAGGRCQAGEYYGPPLSAAPTSAAAGLPSPLTTGGVALTGEICPTNGRAAGLPSGTISQTDELSGGQTQTEVPDILDTSPSEGETMYGGFTALAESGLTLPDGEVLPTDGSSRVSLRILTVRGARVFAARNVDTPRGVPVPALRPGEYTAIWTLSDVNGDTRTLATRFISARGGVGPKPRASVTVSFTGASDVSAVVRFPAEPRMGGSLQITLSRGGSPVALGAGGVRGGSARVTMRLLRDLAGGAWRATLVLTGPHLEPVTVSVPVRWG